MDDSTSNTIRFPFLGSLEDGEVFEYILYSINHQSIEIAIFNWLVNRVKLNQNDKVNLFIPHFLCDQYQMRKNVSGIVINSKPHADAGGEIYQISVDELKAKCTPGEFTKQLPITGDSTNLLIQLIKDSMILKQGIEVYIKHLIPYSSRISSYTNEEYVQIKKHFLLDVQNRIRENVVKLQDLHLKITKNLTTPEEIPVYIDLETLRENFESEISKRLFQIVFGECLDSPTAIGKNYSISMYINAIKNLESRLYSNYNQIVLLYLKSLTFSSSQF